MDTDRIAAAKFWNIRGQQIELSHTKQDYKVADIELNEYEPNKISLEEIGRLLVIKYRDLFRATDQELYKSIPADLKKILLRESALSETACRDILVYSTMHKSHGRKAQSFTTKGWTVMSIDQFKTHPIVGNYRFLKAAI